LWGGNKKDLGTIKAMITEQKCMIEGKGKDRITMKNFKHLIISSNEDWPVHIDRDDRRFFVLSVSEKHKEDHAYFAAMIQQLEQGGYEALLYDLLHEDLTGFNPRHFPHSVTAFHIKMRSADSVHRYVYAALNDGMFDLDQLEGYWEEVIVRKNLYKLYTNWCLENGETIVRNNIFGATLKKIIPELEDCRPVIQGKRQYAYRFPSLIKARNVFCTNFKVRNNEAFAESDTE
jgi:hypothetical protein